MGFFQPVKRLSAKIAFIGLESKPQREGDNARGILD